MDDDAQHEITQLLKALGAGGDQHWDRLFEAVYGELRRLAHGQRGRWHGDETLNTTALVHEAYLKFRHSQGDRPDNRGHFFALASRAMRQILIDRARQRRAQRRGGGEAPVPLDDVDPAAPQVDDELLALDDALNRLARLDDRQARIVECRFFGGLDIDQTAEAVGVSSATVKRAWRSARAWLFDELSAAP